MSIAVVAAGVLLASVVAAVVQHGDDDLALGDNSDAAPDEWDPRVEDLVEFVEEERGLEFDHPVQIDFLTEEEFADELRYEAGDIDEELLEELEGVVPFLRAIGLVEGDLDILETTQDFQEQSVAAFYSYLGDEERMVVPATELTRYDEAIVVHELTHALQDQHHDLESVWPGPDEDNDGLGVQALVEGDANRIQIAYLQSLPRSEQEEMQEEIRDEMQGSPDGIAPSDEFEPDEYPSYLVAYMGAPYTLGQVMAEMIALEGGNAAVDEAFAAPPSLASHLLDPRTYLEDRQFADLDAPEPPDGVDETTDDGEVTALDLYLMLAQRVDLLAALEAADAWDGGAYVVFEQDEQVCVRMTFTGDTDGTTELISDALGDWADAGPDAANATVGQDGDLVAAEACDPGADAELANDRADEAMGIAALRSSLTLEFVQYMGLELDEAWESAECAITELLADDEFDLQEEWSEDELDVVFSCAPL